MKRFIAAMCMLLLATGAFAETQISGVIQHAAWTPEGSPYVLTDDATIASGHVLTIQPGVQVWGSEEALLLIEGGLEAIGTEENPILFTSQTDEYWDGLEVNHPTGDVFLQHCIIENAAVFNGRENGGGMNVRGGNVDIYHSTFRNNYSHCNSSALVAVENADLTVMHTEFVNNEAENAGTFAAWGASVTMQYCLFAENTAGIGAALSLYSGNYYFDHLTIVDNWVENPDNGTVFYSDFMIPVSNSIVLSDQQGPFGGFWPDLNYCCTYSLNHNGDNSFVDDPLFVAPDDGNYHLSEGSPCIDAGDPDFAYEQDGTVTDIGAFTTSPPGDEDPPEEGEIVLSLADVTGIPGHTVNVGLFMEGLTEDVTVYSVDFDLFFDTDFVEVEQVNAAPDGGIDPDQDWMMEWNEVEAGVLSISAAGPVPLPHDGALLSITFDISDAAPNEEVIDVGFLGATLNQGDPEATTVNGSITVMQEVMYGDVSQNGGIEAFDAAMLLRYLTGDQELSDYQLMAAEVSGNEELTSLDAGLILSYRVGEIDQFPVEGGQLFAYGEGTVTIPEEAPFAGVPVVVEDAEQVLAAKIELEYDLDLVSLEDVLWMAGSTVAYVEHETGATIWLSYPEAINGTEGLCVLTFDNPGVSINFARVTLNEYNVLEDVGSTYLFDTGDVDDEADLPLTHGLVEAYPNPFNPTVTLKVELARTDRVSIALYDALGRHIDDLTAGSYTPGRHAFTWNAAQFASGVYFAKVRIGDKQQLKQLFLVK